MPDVLGVDQAAERTARELLGNEADIVGLETQDDTAWLIMPGVLCADSTTAAGADSEPPNSGRPHSSRRRR